IKQLSSPKIPSKSVHRSASVSGSNNSSRWIAFVIWPTLNISPNPIRLSSQTQRSVCFFHIYAIHSWRHICRFRASISLRICSKRGIFRSIDQPLGYGSPTANLPAVRFSGRILSPGRFAGVVLFLTWICRSQPVNASINLLPQRHFVLLLWLLGELEGAARSLGYAATGNRCTSAGGWLAIYRSMSNSTIFNLSEAGCPREGYYRCERAFQLGCKRGLHQLILGNVARLCCFFMLGMEDPLAAAAAALLDAVVRSVSVVASVNMGEYDVYLVSVMSR
ncbi:unnamed protein product, partial [Linum tenue]